MRQLIVCCDGTWNTAEDRTITNVRRLYNALAEKDENDNPQLAYYQPGVGTVRNRLLGGATGFGLSRNVMDAYLWLTTRYEPGDRIALFGFSRGAYTARSLAGMISACGLIDTSKMPEHTIWPQIKRLYREGYRRRDRRDPGWRDGFTFRWDPDDAENIPVHFIGVWETVGALGVPDHLGLLNLLDRPQRFHDLRLNPHIRYGRHALAMDERREPYQPALWTGPFGPNQDVQQVWFPGSHMDVGGGHPERGLSDGALRWMIDEARETIRLGFHKATVEEQIEPDPFDVMHDDELGAIGVLDQVVDPMLRPVREILLRPRPRAVPRIDPQRPTRELHESVYERHQKPPITGGPYRPTRVLAPGQERTIEVFAHEPWNETGLYLEPGEYRFIADGMWQDGDILSGPEGTQGMRGLNPMRERLRMLGSLLGGGERLLRMLTGNELASLVGTRRESDLPWMFLVGVIANDAVAVNGVHHAHERIAIGRGTRCRVTKGGYLYAFANDAWGFYGNNQGSVRLTVARLVAGTPHTVLTAGGLMHPLTEDAAPVGANSGDGTTRATTGSRRAGAGAGRMRREVQEA